jgi:hypothetical protein
MLIREMISGDDVQRHPVPTMPGIAWPLLTRPLSLESERKLLMPYIYGLGRRLTAP